MQGGEAEYEALGVELLDGEHADDLRAGPRFFDWFYGLPLAEPLSLNNYGLAPVSPRVRALAPAEPYQAQMYAEVVELAQRHGLPAAGRVLEVGCGKGGGMGVMAALRPRWQLWGLDCTPKVLGPQPRQWVQERLVVGRAGALPFANGSMDVVVNVESSGSYDDLVGARLPPAHCGAACCVRSPSPSLAEQPRFFAEVARVLRPGGFFLYADYRPRSDDVRRALDGAVHAVGLLLLEVHACLARAACARAHVRRGGRSAT